MAARRSAIPRPASRARRGRKAAEPASRGLETAAVAAPSAEDDAVTAAASRVAEAGGQVLARYADPLGARPLLLAALPLEAVAPTPFQRDLSETHARRLSEVMERIGSFLDPVIAVPVPPERSETMAPAAFWSPNGLHRLDALRVLGARSVVALVSPDPALAYRILALNTEKAHSVKERALEAVRMARGLAETGPERPETDYALELEEGALVTLGLCYESRPRFAGGAYAPTLRQSDVLLEDGIAAALERRAGHAARLLAIDDQVAGKIEALRERGFDSPYLRNFVVARIRPFRPRGRPAPDLEALLGHMEQAVAKFDAGRIRADQVAKTAGSAEE